MSGKDDEPFAERTDLGWSIGGFVNPRVNYGDAIGSSHRIVVRQVTPCLQSPANLTSEVQYISKGRRSGLFEVSVVGRWGL